MTHCETLSTTETTVYEDIAFPQRVHIVKDTFRRAKSGLFYPPHKAFDKVILQETIDYVVNNPVKGKTAFMFAAGSQGWMGTSGRYDRNTEAELHYKTKIPFLTLTNIYAGRIASIFHVHDHVSTDASACASGLKVLMDMQNLFWHYGFDRAIVLAGEDSVCVPSLEFFGDAKANIPLDSTRVPSAFDGTNTGFHVGQGAALAVFEREHPNMSKPMAKFLGAYTSAENNTNPLGQRPDGEGYSKAIDGALTVAKLDKRDVKIVKTHGTGTDANNKAEKAALLRSLDEFVATSYKPRIGHTLSASGLLETGLLLNDLERGIVPQILNRTEADDVFLSYDAPAPQGPFLSLAAGMGNIYSAALFSTEV
jgi:3-oxoacyl-(acyl-carrier-protein) synthase|tara:strand:+ start:52 stop:1149 length:1098 start_codon:yes stop_codon:yes gene_type:complete